MSEEKDYAYFSEALHSSYLFYTMEVDKLNMENKRLREALEKIEAYRPRLHQFNLSSIDFEDVLDIAKQALGE